MKKGTLLSSALIAVSFSAPGALAQEASPEASSETIIVTAQKRAESILEVPLSVTAISADAIGDAGVASLADLTQHAPGLSFDTTGVSRPKMYIRGMGTESFDAGSDPAVAVFIDDVYISRFQGVDLDLLDIERIEVLKGPQGTLFGRNASAGAISVVSRDPDDEFTASAEGSLGNMELVTGKASLSAPLVPGLLTSRFTFGFKEREGYTTNTLNGEDHNNVDRVGGRAQFLLTPSEDLKLRLILDAASADEGMWALKNINNNISAISAAAFSSGLYTRSLDPYSERYSTDGFQERDSWGASVRLDWKVGPGELTSITGYRTFDLNELQDLDATAADVADRGGSEDATSISQELRYDMSFGDRVDLIGGVYYQKEDIERRDVVYFGAQSAFSPLDPDFDIVDEVEVDAESMSVFGKLDFHLTPELTISAGARYGQDSKELARNDYYLGCPVTACAAPFLAGAYAVSADKTWVSFDPSLVVSYQPTRFLHVYASYREGSKSGGFQSQPQPNALTGARVFDPEYVKAYEVGAKLDAWAGKVRLDVAVFQNEYEDLQFLTTSALGGGFTAVVTDNAATATSKGLEIDSVFRPTDWLRLNAGMLFMNAEFDEYIAAGGADFSGRSLVRAPDFSGNFGVQVDLPLGAMLTTSRVDYSYQDEIFFRPDNNPAFSQEAYGIWNASFKLEPESQNWRLTLWGKNLGDELYYQNVIQQSSAGIASYAPPRAYGVTLGIHY